MKRRILVMLAGLVIAFAMAGQALAGSIKLTVYASNGVSDVAMAQDLDYGTGATMSGTSGWVIFTTGAGLQELAYVDVKFTAGSAYEVSWRRPDGSFITSVTNTGGGVAGAWQRITAPAGATGLRLTNKAGTTAQLFEIIGVTVDVVDTTAPAVPGNLTATAGDAQVSLSWSAVADSDRAGYRVYRDGVQVAQVTGASWTDTGLVNGATYAYSVSAYDTTGNESARSATVAATPTAPAPVPDTTAPAVPGGLTAQAGELQVVVSWSAVADTDLAGYRVYRDGVEVADVTGTTHTDTGRTTGTTYSYTVTAYDATGNESSQSIAVVATPTAPSPDPDTTPPDAPTGLIATAGELSVSLTWTASPAPDVQGYRIYRDGVLLGSQSAAGYTDTGLQAGRTYSYMVSAVDTAGNESPQSAPASAVPAAPLVAPSAPGPLTATRGDRSVTLRWTPPATGSVESYQVYRDGAPAATTTATTWKDSGLNPGTTYRYAVTALNGAGESPVVTAEVTTLRAGGLSGVQSNLSGLTGGLSGAMRILLPFFVLAASLIIASIVLGRGLSWLSTRR